MSGRAFRLASGALAGLPLPMARRLGSLGGRRAHDRDERRRHMAERHMARVLGGDPDHPDARAREMALRVFELYGVYLAETLWFRERRIEEVAAGFAFDGLEHFDAAVAAGRGVILALPHVGNWEFAAIHPLRVGVRLIAVAENLPDSDMTEWYRQMRARMGIEIELAGTERAGTRRLLSALEENAAVALVSDRDVTGTGVGVPFFGETTSMPIGPGALARLSGAPLLAVACYLAPTGHRFVLRPVEVPVTADRRADAVAAVVALAGEFEGFIRRDPTQWHVLQPHWPSDPGWRWGSPA